MSKDVVTLKSGQRSLKFIENGTIPCIVYGFLFDPDPAEGVTLEIWYQRKGSKKDK